MAAVDAKHQVVVHAQAFGEGQENALLQPMFEATRENLKATSEEENVWAEAKVSADSGFHSEENMKAVFQQKIDVTSPTTNSESATPASPLPNGIAYGPRRNDENKKRAKASKGGIGRVISSTMKPARA